LKTLEKICALAAILLFFAVLGLQISGNSQASAQAAAFETVSSESAVLSPPNESDKNAQEGALININTADSETLDLLPGIGPALAGRIIAYREDYGPFEETADIIDVTGIGLGIFEKIRGLITV
jgi:competence protein ComEA